MRRTRQIGGLMFDTETDSFRWVPSPKDRIAKAFRGYTSMKRLSIRILQGTGCQNAHGFALFGQLLFSTARTLRLPVMLFQGFFPRTMKKSAATRMTPMRMYIMSVMGRFLLYERFS